MGLIEQPGLPRRHRLTVAGYGRIGEAGVLAAWIVDVDHGELRFFRNPVDGESTDLTTGARPGIVAPQALPGAGIDLTRLLG